MTRAIILAAGQGTRLRPLTNNRPKCLVPFLGKSLLAWQSGVLQDCGVKNIHVVGGYCADQIMHHGYVCSVNPHFETTNMVATLFSAMDYLKGEDDLLISYGDIIYQSENLKAILASDAEISIMCDIDWKSYWSLRFEDPLSDAESFKMDEDGLVKELGKKPASFNDIQGQYTGLIKIKAGRIPEMIDFYERLDKQAIYDGKQFDQMYMTSFLQSLINAGWKIKAIPVKNGWLEVDSVDDLKLYEQLYASGDLSEFFSINL